jgi:tRNA pseudouridine38-40 synthase
MPTYRLHLEYDGSAFRGWQVQPGKRTVQGELHAALSQLFRQPVEVVGAGRTDAGVHALGQVASFESALEFEPRRLLHALAGLLPGDARVWGAGHASAGFSARHSALSRHYRYRLWRGSSAFTRRTHQVLEHEVDLEAMHTAAALWIGEHDFTAFASTRSAASHRRCRVSEAQLRAAGPQLRFDVTADRFLQNMVRRLAGTLVEVGRGRRTVAQVQEALVTGDPRGCGPCLSPAGLFLLEVRYPADRTFEASAVWDAPPGPELLENVR